MNEPTGKDWMDELKSGDNLGKRSIVSGYFSGVFKFNYGEKVYSRIHECTGIVEYCEFTRFINDDQISYKIRFNNAENIQTNTCTVDEEWLDKI